MGLLDGKVVLVSGATQGLGAGIARAAAREGAAVAVTGRNNERGEQVAAELRNGGAAATYVRCDVGDVEQIRSAVAQAVRELGGVDCLVNSAGFTTRGTLLDTEPELFDAHIAVNLRGPFFLMQEVVRRLKDDGRPGTIVNVISSSEHGGQPYLAPYVASKAGLAGLTRNVAHAHRWDRIRINGLNIGQTATEERTPSSASSTTPTTAGSSAPVRRCPWASSVKSTRSPTSWCSCCLTAVASSPAR
jgi:NAD(P)-dependent dehydrogenase (short-subunit alcohol dehydrogenase family)